MARHPHVLADGQAFAAVLGGWDALEAVAIRDFKACSTASIKAGLTRHISASILRRAEASVLSK